MNAAERPRFGVNYVPGTGWWYSWVDWDDDAIAADLRAIARLGCDHIRIHVLWPLFQPNAAFVSPTMLGRLARLMEIADDCDLDVIVTVFDGWLSGFDFRPSWLGDTGNIFTDPDALDGERLLLEAIASRIGGHRRFIGFDLGNEPSVIAAGPNRITTAEGDRWLETMFGHCERVAPGKFHTVGMDHRPWLMESGFSRDALANTGSATPIHAWIFFTGALERYGERGTGTLHLTEYMLELAKAYQRDPERPVWLQEYGIAPEWMHELGYDDFVRAATSCALSVPNVWGVTWWCSHDVSRELKGFLNLEHDLGLLTVSNEVKPSGRAFADMIAATRDRPVRADPRSVALVLPEGRTPDLEFADAFFALLDEGIAPAIVLEENSTLEEHLLSRGITQLVRFDPSGVP